MAIPLILWSPDLLPSGLVIEELVGLPDLAPTLLTLAGLEVPEPQTEDAGESFTDLWQSGAAPEVQPTRLRYSEGNLYNLPAVLIEEGPWRFILRANDRGELYDVTRDPDERFNVALDFPEVTSRLRQLAAPRLTAYLAGRDDSGRPELSPEELRALQALGYAE